MPSRNPDSSLLQLGLPLDAPPAPSSWRPIHYIGSKLRLVDAIRLRLDELDPAQGRTCDLFAGSGTVSMALARDREVVSADIQEYSKVLGTALLRPESIHHALRTELAELIDESSARLGKVLEPMLQFERKALAEASINPANLCDLAEHGSLAGSAGLYGELNNALSETRALLRYFKQDLLITFYFGGAYFSYRQALEMDCILGAIHRAPEKYSATLKAALLSTASDLVNSVGKQFAQPLRPRSRAGIVKPSAIVQMCRDRRKGVIDGYWRWLERYSGLKQIKEHSIIRDDFRNVLDALEDVSVIYADPPYTRDHYSRFYHVLETICLGDFPDISKTHPSRTNQSRGAYRTTRHQSPFCIKSQAPDAFDVLYAKASKSRIPVLLSYSPYIKQGHPRLMTVEAIARIASRYYSSVRILPAGNIVHSKLNKATLHLDAHESAEVFIIAC